MYNNNNVCGYGTGSGAGNQKKRSIEEEIDDLLTGVYANPTASYPRSLLCLAGKPRHHWAAKPGMDLSFPMS